MLNDQLEVQIGTSIYKYLNEDYLVEIHDGDYEVLGVFRQGADVLNIDNVTWHQLTPEKLGNVEGLTGCQDDIGTQRFVNNRTLSVTGFPQAGGCSYSWDYGDGTTATGVQPTPHTYANPGRYILTFTPYCNYAGTICTGTRYYLISTNPATNCNPNPLSGTFNFTVNGSKVTFTAQVNGATQYFWDFGENATSTTATTTSQAPPYTYQRPGTYTVRLTAVNGTGCFLEITRTVTISSNLCCQSDNIISYSYEEYDPGKRRMYFSIWRHNAPLYHRVGVKTRNEYKHNGKWKDKNAEKIKATLTGKVLTTGPKGLTGITDPCSGYDVSVSCSEEKRSKDNADANQGIGDKLATTDRRLISEHAIFYYGQWYTYNLALSRCN